MSRKDLIDNFNTFHATSSSKFWTSYTVAGYIALTEDGMNHPRRAADTLPILLYAHGIRPDIIAKAYSHLEAA